MEDLMILNKQNRFLNSIGRDIDEGIGILVDDDFSERLFDILNEIYERRDEIEHKIIDNIEFV